MSAPYAAALARVATLLAAHAPSRVITRTARDFAAQPDDALAAGIYTLLPRGVEGYDYEASDPLTDPLDGDPEQTALGAFVFVITGQMKLAEDAGGEDIDAAEFAMLAELERFADAGIADETLKDLLLRRSVMSQQQEAPYAWVFTEWRLRLFD
jgi:hypothetical protein